MKRKFSFIASIAFTMLFLAGCATNQEALTAETASGFWETVFVLPLSQFIYWLYELLNYNLGFAIILATAIIRLVLMPLFAQAQKSTAAMQVVQPEMERIKKKYEGKKDPESQQKMNAETMELYKKHKINPMAGCLPMLIQLPIFMAFFQAINRHPLIVNIEEGSRFFGMDLSAVGSVPNYILGVIVALIVFFSQRMMAPKQNNDSTANKSMNTTMKVMNYYFPFMMFMMVIGMPAAMGLHFLTGNLVQMLQSFIFRRPAAGPPI